MQNLISVFPLLLLKYGILELVLPLALEKPSKPPENSRLFQAGNEIPQLTKIRITIPVWLLHIWLCWTLIMSFPKGYFFYYYFKN